MIAVLYAVSRCAPIEATRPFQQRCRQRHQRHCATAIRRGLLLPELPGDAEGMQWIGQSRVPFTACSESMILENLTAGQVHLFA